MANIVTSQMRRRIFESKSPSASKTSVPRKHGNVSRRFEGLRHSSLRRHDEAEGRSLSSLRRRRLNAIRESRKAALLRSRKALMERRAMARRLGASGLTRRYESTRRIGRIGSLDRRYEGMKRPSLRRHAVPSRSFESVRSLRTFGRHGAAKRFESVRPLRRHSRLESIKRPSLRRNAVSNRRFESIRGRSLTRRFGHRR